MSELVRQIRQCMSDLSEAGDGKLTARFLFTPDFIGFRGHFPGRPVLPAVCEIQASVAMLETWKRREVRLKEITLAKFSAPVTCDEEVVYSCSFTMENSHSTFVKVNVAKAGKRIAKFTLKVAFLDEGWGR